jgi:hypothetical protein
MLALDAIEPVAVLVTGGGEQVVNTAGVGDDLQDRAAVIGVEALARAGAELVDPHACVHRREMLVEVGGVESPEVGRLLSARIGDANV